MRVEAEEGRCRVYVVRATTSGLSCRPIRCANAAQTPDSAAPRPVNGKMIRTGFDSNELHRRLHGSCIDRESPRRRYRVACRQA